MTVTPYTEDAPHPSGFIGLRVAVWCRASGLLQRYYALGGVQDPAVWARKRRAADRLDAQWRKRQQRERRAGRLDRTDRPYGWRASRTGVRGIRMRFRRHPRVSGWHWSPLIAVSVHDASGARQNKTFTVGGDRTLGEAWLMAVRHVCRVERIQGARRAALLAHPRPCRADFDRLRKYMNREHGHQIPVRALPHDED